MAKSLHFLQLIPQETEMLRNCHLLPLNLFTGGMFQTRDFVSIAQLSQSFAACVPTFSEPVAGIKIRMKVYFHKQYKFSLYIKYLVFCIVFNWM